MPSRIPARVLSLWDVNSTMRPKGSVGEIRLAIRAAVRDHGPMAQAEIVKRAQAACIGRDAARFTVKNMVRAGELTSVGTVRRNDCPRPVSVYALTQPGDGSPQADHDGGLVVLRGALSAWR